MSSERQAFNDGFDKGYSKSLDKIAKLEVGRDEYRNLYHLGEAKISSREAIIESLSETELAKDVTRLEAENEALREGIERLEFLSHLAQGIPTTPNDRLDLIGEEASALLKETD